MNPGKLTFYLVCICGLVPVILVNFAANVESSPAPVSKTDIIQTVPFYDRLQCQPGYSGTPLEVIKKAHEKCKVGKGETDFNCRSVCMGKELKMVIYKQRFNKNQLKILLKDQLPNEGGKEAVNRIMRDLQNCGKFTDDLHRACEDQARFWECVEKAFKCPSSPSSRSKKN